MLGRTYDDQVCSIARTLEVLSLGVARNVLTDRLRRPVDAGVLERQRYQVRPERFGCRLTPAGRELAVPLVALMHWGDRHRPGPDGPPRHTRHHDCGGDLHTVLVCDRCDAAVSPAELDVLPGPALTSAAPG